MPHQVEKERRKLQIEGSTRESAEVGFTQRYIVTGEERLIMRQE